MSIAAGLAVLTANLFNDRTEPRAFDDLIRRTAPDIVAVQELGPECARVLEQHFDHGFLRPQVDYNGMGLATTVEVEAEEVDTPDPRPITAVAKPALANRSDGLLLMSVRLPPPFSRRWVTTRGRYARTLAGIIDVHRGPICLAGDLNATPAWPVYRILVSGLSDGVRQARPSLLSRGATWPSRLPLFRIDHVLVRGLTVSHAEQVKISGTDHKGVLAHLTL